MKVHEAPEYVWEDGQDGPQLVFYPKGARPTYAFAVERSEKTGRAELSVSCERCGNFTRVRVGDQEEVFARKAKKSFALDIENNIGANDLSALAKVPLELRVKFEITVTFQNTEPVKVDVDKKLRFGAGFFDPWTKGKVRFAEREEPPDDGKRSALLFHMSSVSGRLRGGQPVLYGEGTKLTDLDWIILHESKPTGNVKHCAVSGLGQFDLESVDSQLRVYDRRTGKVVEEHTLRAGPPNCGLVTVKSRGASKLTSGVGQGKLEAWVKQKLSEGQ